jgi:hypothetical protein
MQWQLIPETTMHVFDHEKENDVSWYISVIRQTKGYRTWYTTMIFWRCHSNSVNTGSHQPNISDIKRWKRWNVIGIDYMVSEEFVFTKCLTDGDHYLILCSSINKWFIQFFLKITIIRLFRNHANSDHVPSFSSLDVWNVRLMTSGVYAITVVWPYLY